MSGWRFPEKLRTNVKIFVLGCLFLQLFMVPAAWAGSILDIPKGTVFELLEELEIPANRDFTLLGQSAMDEAFNSTGQVLNDMTGRPLGQVGGQSEQHGYLTFYSYYRSLFVRFEETYRDCQERHRVYVRVPGSPPAHRRWSSRATAT